MSITVGGILNRGGVPQNLQVQTLTTSGDAVIGNDLTVNGDIIYNGQSLGGLVLQGTWNADTNVPDLTAITPENNQFWIVSDAGDTTLGPISDWAVNDWALYINDGWTKISAGNRTVYATLDVGDMTLTGSSITVNSPATDLTITTPAGGSLSVPGIIKTSEVFGTGTAANGTLNLFSGGTSTLFLSTTGFCGIGLTTPLSPLHVSGSVATTPDQAGVHLGLAGTISVTKLSGTGGGRLDFQNATGLSEYSGRIAYSHTSNQLSFFTNATQSLLIDNAQNAAFSADVSVAGNLAVNRSSVSANANLDVAGDFAITNETTQTAYWAMDRDNTGRLSIKDEATARLSMETTGQVILAGSDSSFDVTPPVSGLQLYYEQDTGLATIGSYRSGLAGQIVFRTNTGGAGASEKMRISNTGGIGMGGITSPAYTLDLGSSEVNDGYSLRVRSNPTAGSSRVQFSNSAGNQQNGFIEAGDTQYFAFGTVQEVFRVINNKNFCIGVENTSSKLHVKKDDGNGAEVLTTLEAGAPSSPNSTNDSVLRLIGKGTGTLPVPSFSNTTEIKSLGIGNAGSIMAFYTSLAGTLGERMRICDTGAVCIDTSDEFNGALVNISEAGLGIGASTSNGQFRRCYMDGAYNLLWNNGNNSASLTTAGVWTDASDRSYKKSIQDLNYGLSTIQKLKPKSFFMKESPPDDERHIGFIAQELKEIVPECVFGEDGQMSVSYGRLVAVLVNAVNELTEKVKTLENTMKGEA